MTGSRFTEGKLTYIFSSEKKKKKSPLFLRFAEIRPVKVLLVFQKTWVSLNNAGYTLLRLNETTGNTIPLLPKPTGNVTSGMVTRMSFCHLPYITKVGLYILYNLYILSKCIATTKTADALLCFTRNEKVRAFFVWGFPPVPPPEVYEYFIFSSGLCGEKLFLRHSLILSHLPGWLYQQ